MDVKGNRLVRIGCAAAAAAMLGATAGMTGCVRRTISITSDPIGALVWVNDREVGRTPLDVEFLHYGTYDVRLVKDGYEPKLTTGEAQPPLWDNVGLDLVAEVLPLDFRSDIAWHYVLEPTEGDTDALRRAMVERAREMRENVE